LEILNFGENFQEVWIFGNWIDQDRKKKSNILVLYGFAANYFFRFECKLALTSFCERAKIFHNTDIIFIFDCIAENE
jgi:hypothetical protein